MKLIPVHIAHVGMGSAVHLVSPDVPVLVPCVACLGAMRGLRPIRVVCVPRAQVCKGMTTGLAWIAACCLAA